MRFTGILHAAVVGLLLAVPASAQDGVNWQTDLAAARKLAAETDRLVLLHFWTPTCQPCLRLERQVFNQPGFGETLEAHYVPVKINAQANPEIAEQYGVDRWPTDVVIDSNGEVLWLSPCPANASQYANHLGRAANDYARQHQLAASEQPPDGRPARTSWSRQPEIASAGQTVEPEQRVAERSVAPPQDDLADYDHYDRAPARREAAPATEMQATQPPPRAQLTGSQPQRQQNPPLALDGHCPVHLVQTSKWVRGDVRWGAIHRGRTYLFTTQQCQQAFLTNPDFYSPVLSGNDPVAAVDEGRLVPGRREYGVTFLKPEIFEGQIYLFSSEATRKIFEENHDRYAAAVSQMR